MDVPEFDFERDTRLVRRWLNHQTVHTDHMVEELRKLLNWAEGRYTSNIMEAWKVLVDEAEANPEHTDDFLHHFPSCGEYRFMGALGFGGKIYASGHEPFRVDTYPELMTPGKAEIIERVNARLKEIPWASS